MARRDIPEVNAGSMADIAFLLLIFFLLTTTMDVDSGITRKLPPPPEEDQEEQTQEINKRNIFVVLINRNNDLLVGGEPVDITQLRDKTKEFILNPAKKENLSEGVTIQKKIEDALEDEKTDLVQDLRKAKELLGNRRISKGVVSLQNDRGTTYDQYIKVQNELVAAFNEIRDEIAMENFGEKYEDLDEEEQDVIQTVIPLAISEAEPRNVGGN